MEQTDLWEDSFKRMTSFLDEVVRPQFPYAKYLSAGMTGNPDIPPKSFDAHLSISSLFKGTPYEAPEKGEILHYTSISGMLSMLQENGIRLSPFSNLSDSQELLYAASKHTGLIEQRISEVSSRLKPSFYSLSGKLSDIRPTDMDKDTYMWETYGRGGAGVYIRLEFAEMSPYFGLGKILYGESPLEIIKDLDIKANEFFTRNDFTLISPGEFFSLVHAFHKSLRYHQEKEVRLLFDGTQYLLDSLRDRRYVYEADKKGNIVKKVFIPFDSTSGSVPNLKISQIVFGYECLPIQVIDYVKLIRNIYPNSNLKIGMLNNELEYKWF